MAQVHSLGLIVGRASIAVWLLWFAFAAAPASAQLVGTVQGKFGVGEGGAAQYNIPIAVPPGTLGVQPEISLSYDSSGGDGIMGVGWSLGGLSTISRCAPSKAQDGYLDPINFQLDDRLCLDGERLMLRSGAYNLPGSAYRTEHESWSRVMAFGSGAGGFPTNFVVDTKSGRTLRFGYVDGAHDGRIEAQGGSGISRLWALTTAGDKNGNLMRFAYGEDTATGEYWPTSITYTENPAAGVPEPGFARVEFAYTTRVPTDQSRSYVGGALVTQSKLLTTVTTCITTTTCSASNLVREYRLSYQPSPENGRSRMVSVTECGAGNQCLPPTTFDWQTDGAGWTSSTAFRVPRELIAVTTVGDVRSKALLSDVNRDGFADYVHAYDGDSNLRETYLNSPTGFASTASSSWRLPAYLFKGTHAIGTLVDLDADGYPDFVQAYDGNNIGQGDILLNTWINRRTGFVASADVSWRLPGVLWDYSGTRTRQTAMLIDLNADGRPDFVRAYTDSNGGDNLQTNLNTGAGFGAAEPATGLKLPASIWKYGETSNRQVGTLIDINGDRLPDLVRAFKGGTSGTTIETYINTGTGFEPQPDSNYALPDILWDYSSESQPSRRIGELADVNGDGLVDFVQAYVKNGGASERRTYLNTGAGFVPDPVWSLPTDLLTYENGKTQQYGLMADLNGDGLLDVVRAYKGVNNTVFRDTWINTGNGFETSPDAGYAVPQELWTHPDWNTTRPQATLADIDGDGDADFVRGYKPPSGSIIYDTRLNNKKTGDRVVRITDGLGAVLDVTYKPISQPTVYTAGVAATYPVLTIADQHYVVSRYTTSDGIGGARGVSFTYGGMKTHLLRADGLGFATRTITDEARNLRTTTNFGQTFPEEGTLQSSSVVNLSTGFTVSSATNLWDHVTTSGPGISQFHEVRLRQTTTSTRELNNAVVSTVDEYLTYDVYGNVIEQRTDSHDGYTSRTNYTYSTDGQDLSAWLLGLVTTKAETATAPGFVEPQPRVQVFAYAPGTGRIANETTEPNDPALAVYSTYSYDLFGNPSSASVSAAGLSSRQVLTFYDQTGRFASLTVNEAGHALSQVFDGRFGVPVSEQGPNFSVAALTFTYDALGRPTGGSAPGGISTAISRASTNAACPAATRMATTKQTSGVPTGIACNDVLGRTIREVTTGFDGTLIYTDTEFDAVGRPAKRSLPYFNYDAPPKWTTTTFDVLDRPLTVKEPSAPSTNVTSTFEYTPFTIKTTNPLGQTRHEIRNSRNEVVEVRDTYGRSNYYTYDAFGNPVQIVDPVGNQTTVQFDRLGRKTRLVDPDSGVVIYAYNAYGELVYTKDARLLETTYEYDPIGRMTRRTAPEGVSTWIYDTATNGVGNLASESGPQVQFSRTFAYDSNGRQSTITTSVDGTPRVVSFLYDSVSRVSRIVYPTLFAVERVYNSFGYLSQVRRYGGTSTTLYWTAQGVSAEGQIKREQLGDLITTENYFDVFTGRPTNIVTSVGGSSSIQSAAYTWDSVGNLKTRSDSVVGGSETFLYDNLNRLTRVTSSAAPQVDIAYDPIGNITSKTGVGTYTYPAAGAARPHGVSGTSVGAKSYLYDASGNLTSYAGQTTIAYNSFGKPNTIASVSGTRAGTYYYGSDRELVKRVETASDLPNSGGTWVLIGGLYEEFTRGGVTEYRHYIEGGGRTVAIHTERSTGLPDLKYLHVDHLGSTNAITNSAGVVIERQSYDAHGVRRNSNWTPPPLGGVVSVITPAFTGHTQLDLFSLIYMKARMYDPVLGRFLSPDAIVQFPFSTQGFNRYTYVNNNPLSFIDPDGNSIGGWLKRLGKTGWGKYLVNAVVYVVGYVVGTVIDYFLPGIGTLLRTMLISAVQGAIGGSLQAAMNGESISAGLWNGVAAGIASGGTQATRAMLAPTIGGFGGSTTIPLPTPGEDVFSNGGFDGTGTCPNQAICIEGDVNPIGNINGVDFLASADVGTPIVQGAVKAASGDFSGCKGGCDDAFKFTLTVLPIPGAQSLGLGRWLGPALAKLGWARRVVTGQWARVAESMSARAMAYQARITGRAGEAFIRNGVKFDGIANGVLLEAKGAGYATFVRNGSFQPWFKGADGLISQAQRQLAAAEGAAIRWHFAEEAAANATRALFQQRGIRGIEVLFTP